MKEVIVEAYLGIDVGSVTTKFAVLNADDDVLFDLYLPTGGQPVRAIQEGLRRLGAGLPGRIEIRGAATTGSARSLAGAITGADIVKNEITCQAVAAIQAVPGVRTVLEIGGQDSKLICITDEMVTDFGMNTVCAAGTGSFLDHQAARLQMSIEEFSRRALSGGNPVRISGRCTVFAESDMIHKQQTGHNVDDIIYGLCRALVQNYLSDVGSGKEILAPVVFQGGVAFNQGIVRALKEELGTDIIVPHRHEVMGAIGAALLAHEHAGAHPGGSLFRGFDIGYADYRTTSFECDACPTTCEIVRVMEGDEPVAAWGGICDKWHINLVQQGVK
ncbi:MAG: acyl-CoA dehydratase activase [Dehalococcoidales bacterium]|nr:acyl-CoA dehydratase activase [Dehalococcoidales bacterium]